MPKLSSHELMRALDEYARTLGWEFVESRWQDDNDGASEYKVWVQPTAQPAVQKLARTAGELVPVSFGSEDADGKTGLVVYWLAPEEAAKQPTEAAACLAAQLVTWAYPDGTAWVGGAG